MLLLLRTLLICASCLFVQNPARADNKPLPPNLQSCLTQAVKELLLLPSDERQRKVKARALFDKWTDIDLTGKYNINNRWNHETEQWRRVAIDIYFDMLYNIGMKMANNVPNLDHFAVEGRLADRPDLRASVGSHVILRVTLDPTKQDTVIALYVTARCKVFRIQQGAWITVNRSDVDAAVKRRPNS